MSDTTPVESKTWYPYVPFQEGSDILIYTRSPVTLNADSPQPASTSPWKPPEAAEGFAVYFVHGYAWAVRPDIRKATLSNLQTIALRSALTEFQAQVSALAGNYSPEEQKSWAQQVSDAQSVLSGGTSTMLPVLAAARGIELKTLAQKIVDKATAYSSGYATALAAYQKASDAINKATKLEDLPTLTAAGLGLA